MYIAYSRSCAHTHRSPYMQCHCESIGCTQSGAHKPQTRSLLHLTTRHQRAPAKGEGHPPKGQIPKNAKKPTKKPRPRSCPRIFFWKICVSPRPNAKNRRGQNLWLLLVSIILITVKEPSPSTLTVFCFSLRRNANFFTRKAWIA